MAFLLFYTASPSKEDFMALQQESSRTHGEPSWLAGACLASFLP